MPWSKLANDPAITSAKLAAGATSATYVATLPASPVDGQEVFYQATSAVGGATGAEYSMADKGIVWHLRYRSASSSIYKWEFVGGQEVYSFVNADITGGTDSIWREWTDQRIVFPLAGEYEISFGTYLSSRFTGATMTVSYALSNDSGTLYTNTDRHLSTQVTQAGNGMIKRQQEVTAAGVVLRQWNWGNGYDASWTTRRRWINVKPTRVKV